MSRSKSSQSSVVNNHNINNVLDGGAIKASFDFADGIADEAFDSLGNSLDVVSDALKSNEAVTTKALDTNSHVIDEAFDNSEVITRSALESLREQNNRSLDTLAGLQGQQASTNFKLLEGIQSTVKSNNTGGASDVLTNQKYLYLVMALVVIGFLVLTMNKGK